MSWRLFAGFLVLSSALVAQVATQAAPADLASLQAAIKASQSAGDNAWMLTSAALVLLMTGPGLALFYGGLVRKKNVLGTMMQSFAMMAVVSLIWAVCGYSLVFAPGNAFIGGFLSLRLPARGRRDPEPRLRSHHPASDVHDLSAHVRHHHARLDCRRLRRADAVRGHGVVLLPLAVPGLLPRGSHGLGRGRLPERQPGRAGPGA